MILAKNLDHNVRFGVSIGDELCDARCALNHGLSEIEIDNHRMMLPSGANGKRASGAIMFKRLLVATAFSLFLGSIATATAAVAQAKTAKVCAEEYKANKPALRAAKEKKGEFISACRALPVGTPTPIGSVAAAPASPVAPSALPARTSTVGALKTAGACNDEYKANKGALKDAKEKKKDFITACRALAPGTPTPIGTAAAAPIPAPTVAPSASPVQTAAPRQAPASAPSRTPAPSAATASAGANEFAAEAGAKARCPSATVVWVNTKSKVYHFAGTKNYGNTKAGAYMCESDATAAGDRASTTEKHP